MKTLHSLVVLIVFATLSSSCGSLGYKKAQDTSTSLRETAKSIDNSIAPLDAVILALDNLTNNPNDNIVNQYQDYRSAVKNLESSISIINSRANDMQALGDDYFLNWEGELAKIESYDIKTNSRARKRNVSVKFNALSENYLALNKSLIPFMSDLADIRTAMGTDLTRDGLRSVEASLNQANREATRIRDSLTKMSADFSELGVELATPPSVASTVLQAALVSPTGSSARISSTR